MKDRSITNPADGQTYVVLNNPWGTDHPAPIPASALGNLFVGAFGAALPAKPSGTSGTGGDDGG